MNVQIIARPSVFLAESPVAAVANVTSAVQVGNTQPGTSFVYHLNGKAPLRGGAERWQGRPLFEREDSGAAQPSALVCGPAGESVEQVS